MTYAYEGKTIRLTQKDYDQWNKVFWAIPDFDAELFSLDVFYTEQGEKKWFIRCSRALLKAHNKGLQNARTDSDALREGLYTATMAGQPPSGPRGASNQGDGTERPGGGSTLFGGRGAGTVSDNAGGGADDIRPTLKLVGSK